MIVFRTVYEEHHIRILLDGTRLTQVAELGSLSVSRISVLHRAVELRERQHRYVQFLGKSFERAADVRHLLLTTAEAHAAGVHQLQVVYHQCLYTVLASQSASLGTQFEDREVCRIVDIHWSTLHLIHVLIKPLPLVGRKLSVEQFRARYLTHIGYQSVHQLYAIHLQREESHRFTIVYRNILQQAQRKRSLTHSWSTCDDDKVTRLPSRGDVVEFMIARRHTRQTATVLRSLHQYAVSLWQYVADVLIVLHHVLLRDLVERSLRPLHQVVHIHRLVEGVTLHH